MNGSQKTFRSGELDCPTSADVIRIVLDRLQNSDDWGWAWIWPAQSAWKRATSMQAVQVCVHEGSVLVDILGFPFRKDFERQLNEHAIRIPDSWKVEKCKPKRLLGNGWLSMRAPAREKEEIVSFVLSVIHLLFGADERCSIEAELLKA